MSGSNDSQKDDDVESSIHPIHSSTPSKKDNFDGSQSRNVTSIYNSSFESTSTKKSYDNPIKNNAMGRSSDSQKEDNVESSAPLIRSAPSSKKDNFNESPSRNVANAYDNSIESTSRKSSDYASKSRQASLFDLSSTAQETESPPVKCLSAWEKWLCHKEEEKRKHLQQLNEKRRQKEIENRLMEEKKLEKKLLADAAHEKWLKRVDNNKRRQLKIQRERAEQERKLREEKECLIKELAPQKYYNWKSRKDKLIEEKQREEKIKTQAKLEKLEEKKQLNEEAFNKWLRKVSTRPKSYCSIGYGYAGGVLISYHDGTSSPRPSFCNPKPWIHCTEDSN